MSDPAVTSTIPLCPVTGEPARRLVQWVSAELLTDLWRIGMRVDVRASFGDTRRFGLWESPTGLYFFDPMRAGDPGFYTTLYARLNMRRHMQRYASKGWSRAEFALAARHVRENDRVLDVGCGFGAFRHEVRHARYAGLDPHFSGEPGADWARIGTLTDHLRENAGAYDVCTAFQVLEHVEDPVGMLADMVRAVRPGGRVIVGVPHVPAAPTRIPNYLINAVPHHLTWWTTAALETIAARVGLTKIRVEPVPWSELDGIVYWMSRCSPVKCRTRHYRHSWAWHASSVVGFLAGYLMWKLKPAPTPGPADEGALLMLIAEKPATA